MLDMVSWLPAGRYWSDAVPENSICLTCFVQYLLQLLVHVSSDRRISTMVTPLHCTIILGPGSLVIIHSNFASLGRAEGKSVEDLLHQPKKYCWRGTTSNWMYPTRIGTWSAVQSLMYAKALFSKTRAVSVLILSGVASRSKGIFTAFGTPVQPAMQCDV